jgi:hypothetical protein
MTRRYLLSILAAAATVSLAGCKKSPPPIVAVSGVITLGGKPLDQAEVRFYPQWPELASDFVGIAITDDSGAFTIATNGQPGCAQCEHKVVVVEGPPPKEARGESAKAQMAMELHLRTLKNRPIPLLYANLPDTPLTIAITGPQGDLKIELNK